MSPYKVNVREEIAVRQWQRVINFGVDTVDNVSTGVVTSRNSDCEPEQKLVNFEVMP